MCDTLPRTRRRRRSFHETTAVSSPATLVRPGQNAGGGGPPPLAVKDRPGIQLKQRKCGTLACWRLCSLDGFFMIHGFSSRIPRKPPSKLGCEDAMPSTPSPDHVTRSDLGTATPIRYILQSLLQPGHCDWRPLRPAVVVLKGANSNLSV